MYPLFLLDIMKDFINPLRPYWLELSMLVGLLIFLMLLGVCETIRKSGRAWWGGFIPFYNIYLLFDIAYRNGRKCLSLLIPIYNIYVLLVFPFDLAKKFHHKNSFGLFLLLFPFGGYPVLGFDDKQCVDPIPRKEKSPKEILKSTPQTLQISEPVLNPLDTVASKMPAPLDVLETEEMLPIDGSIPEVQMDVVEEKQKDLDFSKNGTSIFDIESTSFHQLKNSFDESLKAIEEARREVSEAKVNDSFILPQVSIKVEDSSSIFDLDSPSFRILKDSFDASLKDIENREEFKIQKIDVSVPKESTPLFGETVTALLKNSMENSLKLVDASISRSEPMVVKEVSISNEEPITKEEGTFESVNTSSENISLASSISEEKNDINDMLLDELTTINAIFDQEENKEAEKVKATTTSTDNDANILSNEISLIDSILS